MVLSFCVIVVGLSCVNAVVLQDAPANPIFGYISKYGIPEARRIARSEQDYRHGTLRIIGGVPAAIGQYPYQAGLISNFEDTDDRAACGGSLVSASKVLTAAHCWYDGETQAGQFEVVLGSTFLFSGGTRFNTSNVTMHPDWDPSVLCNDIAVIHLPIAVAFSDIISPVALPSASEIDQSFVGARAIASGFGLTDDDGDVSDDQSLSHVRLKVIENRACACAYPFLIRPSHICTSSIGGINTCNGDSGGPLVVRNNGTHILIGITSFGSIFGCASGWPSVYTRVTSHLQFINQYTHVHNFTPRPPRTRYETRTTPSLSPHS